MERNSARKSLNNKTITDTLRQCEPGTALARYAASMILNAAQVAVARGPEAFFRIAVPGGSTPTATFACLADPALQGAFPWQRTHIFWIDERCVAPSHERSNFLLAQQTLLSRVPLSEGNVHRMQGELDPAVGALAYENDLRAHFASNDRTAEGFPRFDLVLLGVGNDGHIASLFPGVPALEERSAWVVPSYEPTSGEQRLTLTYPVLEAAREILVLIEGKAKAAVVSDVFEGDADLPVKRLAPIDGRIEWLIGSDAIRQR